jgi:integrase
MVEARTPYSPAITRFGSFFYFWKTTAAALFRWQPPIWFHRFSNIYSPPTVPQVSGPLPQTYVLFSGSPGTKNGFFPTVPSRCARSKPIIPILSEKENDALRRVLQTQKVPLRDKAIILLALRTGLRAVDIVRMKLRDIDWVNDTISIVQSKRGASFKIPLTADVGNALSAYILNERPKTDNPCIFLRFQAPFRPLSDHSACYALVRRTFHRAGIRLNNERKGIHVMRHSAASRMLSRGVPVTTISSMLGHSNKYSTDVYLSTDEKRMRECVLSLAEIPMNCGGLK